ncbi:MAG: four helix bundle protein [Tenuifilaceae bacterium]
MNNLSDRFLVFVVEVIKQGKKLNKSFEGRHIYGQLFRSSSSSGANYEESQSAESKADFIHKLQVVLKELKESLFWLKLINKIEFIDQSESNLPFLLRENQELIKIIAKSIVTTKGKVN